MIPDYLMSTCSLMARPVTIRTEQIVETARSLFLQHGFTLSTARIAKEIGISEGSIFKRFATKDALFAAAMGLPSTDFAHGWSERAGQGALHEEMVAISHRIVAHFRVMLPRIIMLRRASSIDPLSVMSQADSPPPVELLDGVTAYLGREVDLGRVALDEPRVAARMLVGGLMNFVFFEVMGFETHDDVETHRTIDGMVALLIAGGTP